MERNDVLNRFGLGVSIGIPMGISVAIAICIVFMMGHVSSAEAKTIYVSGLLGPEIDVNADCTEAAACSVDGGIKAAQKGDVVQFSPGDCRCPFETQKDGVTFRGAPGLTTRLLDDRDASNGNQIVRIIHDDIVIEGFVIDGEKRPNSGHGLVRMGSAKRIVIRGNRIVNSGSAHISLGGSMRESRIQVVEISNNTLCDSGFTGEFGEAIYISDVRGTSRVKEVRIFGNEICRFSDNAIDLKPGATEVEAFDNWIHDQIERAGKQGNQGTIVTQDWGHHIHHNIFENLIGGSSVFNLAAHAENRVRENVIIGVTNTTNLVRSRTGGNQDDTIVTQNQFCNVNTKSLASDLDGINVFNNNGLDLPEVDCAPRRAALMAQYEGHRSDAKDEPSPLADLNVTDIFLARFSDVDVRLVFETVDGSPVQVSRRVYKEDSVRFFDLDGRPLGIRRNKAAEERPEGPGPGWVWHLMDPLANDENIRMEADAGWITGGPAINQELQNFNAPPVVPVVDMMSGDSGSCEGEVMIFPRTNGNGNLIVCSGAQRKGVDYEFNPGDSANCPGEVMLSGNGWDPFVVIQCQ